MKPVIFPGYGHYHISEEGIVVNTLSNKVLKYDVNSSGYLRVTLVSDQSKKFRMTVHRLVAIHYCKYGDGNSFEGLVVNHKDGEKKNNHYTNLEWITSSENRKHAFRNKLCGRPNSKLTDAQVHIICASIERQVPAKDVRKSLNIPKHVYDDIRSRRYYKDISSQYNW